MEEELQDFGIMTAEWNDDNPNYDLRKISKYCNDKNIDPSSLTDEELEQFIIK